MSAPFELFAPPNAWDDEFISSLERKQRKAQDKADVLAFFGALFFLFSVLTGVFIWSEVYAFATKPDKALTGAFFLELWKAVGAVLQLARGLYAQLGDLAWTMNAIIHGADFQKRGMDVTLGTISLLSRGLFCICSFLAAGMCLHTLAKHGLSMPSRAHATSVAVIVAQFIPAWLYRLGAVRVCTSPEQAMIVAAMVLWWSCMVVLRARRRLVRLQSSISDASVRSRASSTAAKRGSSKQGEPPGGSSKAAVAAGLAGRSSSKGGGGGSGAGVSNSARLGPNHSHPPQPGRSASTTSSIVAWGGGGDDSAIHNPSMYAATMPCSGPGLDAALDSSRILRTKGNQSNLPSGKDSRSLITGLHSGSLPGSSSHQQQLAAQLHVAASSSSLLPGSDPLAVPSAKSAASSKGKIGSGDLASQGHSKAANPLQPSNVTNAGGTNAGGAGKQPSKQGSSTATTGPGLQGSKPGKAGSKQSQPQTPPTVSAQATAPALSLPTPGATDPRVSGGPAKAKVRTTSSNGSASGKDPVSGSSSSASAAAAALVASAQKVLGGVGKASSTATCATAGKANKPGKPAAVASAPVVPGLDAVTSQQQPSKKAKEVTAPAAVAMPPAPACPVYPVPPPPPPRAKTATAAHTTAAPASAAAPAAKAPAPPKNAWLSSAASLLGGVTTAKQPVVTANTVPVQQQQQHTEQVSPATAFAWQSPSPYSTDGMDPIQAPLSRTSSTSLGGTARATSGTATCTVYPAEGPFSPHSGLSGSASALSPHAPEYTPQGSSALSMLAAAAANAQRAQQAAAVNAHTAMPLYLPQEVAGVIAYKHADGDLDLSSAAANYSPFPNSISATANITARDEESEFSFFSHPPPAAAGPQLGSSMLLNGAAHSFGLAGFPMDMGSDLMPMLPGYTVTSAFSLAGTAPGFVPDPVWAMPGPVPGAYGGARPGAYSGAGFGTAVSSGMQDWRVSGMVSAVSAPAPAPPSGDLAALGFVDGDDTEDVLGPGMGLGGSGVVGAEAEGGSCCVCWSAPRTVGFLHGKTSHLCVCKNCARQLREGARCPVCRQVIERIIDIF